MQVQALNDFSEVFHKFVDAIFFVLDPNEERFQCQAIAQQVHFRGTVFELKEQIAGQLQDLKIVHQRLRKDLREAFKPGRLTLEGMMSDRSLEDDSHTVLRYFSSRNRGWVQTDRTNELANSFVAILSLVKGEDWRFMNVMQLSRGLRECQDMCDRVAYQWSSGARSRDILQPLRALSRYYDMVLTSAIEQIEKESEKNIGFVGCLTSSQVGAMSEGQMESVEISKASAQLAFK